MAHARVVLHRVGPDRAGPLDSGFTSAAGAYRFSYRPYGSPDALYFVSTSYGGIAYFSQPTRADAVGDAAAITVFDTTSGPLRVRLAGRHVIVSAPEPDGRREIAEVYDLANDSSLTRVSRDGATPTWMTHLPAGAAGFRVNPAADIAPGAVTMRGDSVLLFAPLSPGIRQLSFVYSLGSKAFPLKLPMEQAATVLEVLTEEPGAKVSAVHLKQAESFAANTRRFKRFLAEDVPANTILTIDPPGPEMSRSTYIAVVAAALGVAMIAGLAAAFHRRARRPTAVALSAVTALPASPEYVSEALLRDLAALDARMEHAASVGGEDRVRYAAERAALKSRLAAALAAERQSQ